MREHVEADEGVHLHAADRVLGDVELIPPVRLSSSDAETNEQHRLAILRWCLDIGASCVTEYPYGDHDRFSTAEKACFEDIFKALR